MTTFSKVWDMWLWICVLPYKIFSVHSHASSIYMKDTDHFIFPAINYVCPSSLYHLTVAEHSTECVYHILFSAGHLKYLQLPTVINNTAVRFLISVSLNTFSGIHTHSWDVWLYIYSISGGLTECFPKCLLQFISPSWCRQFLSKHSWPTFAI